MMIDNRIYHYHRMSCEVVGETDRFSLDESLNYSIIRTDSMAMQEGFSVKKYLLFTFIEFLFSCSCIYCEARVILNL